MSGGASERWSVEALEAGSAERPTPDPSREGSGISNVEHRTSNFEPPTSNLQPPTSNIQRMFS